MSGAFAQNPIISTWFTPDPAPYVHNDTLYLFVDHDEDDAQYFKMKRLDALFNYRHGKLDLSGHADIHRDIRLGYAGRQGLGVAGDRT